MGKSMNDNAKLLQNVHSSPPVSSSKTERNLGFDAAPLLAERSKTIQFGQANVVKHKYVCTVKGMENESHPTLIGCVEFMLKSLWDLECTKKLYPILVKRLSNTHKCKLFSVGVKRKDRKFKLFKKIS